MNAPLTTNAESRRRYWVFITRYQCVLCGRSRESRERRYDERPDDPHDRMKYINDTCEDHFM